MTFLNHIVYKYVILLLLLQYIIIKTANACTKKNLVQGALCLCACSRLSVKEQSLRQSKKESK